MYEAKKFDQLLGLEGFSDILLKDHFTLYEGYVANTNKVADILADKKKNGSMGTAEYGELKRRFGWEFNGMRLHEYYFENLTKDTGSLDMGSKLGKKLVDIFGSYEAWEQDFRVTGAMRGIGWVVLAYDKQGDKLFNVWINEHDAGYLAGAVPLLVMDVFEHAFMLDYGLKRVEYIDAFWRAIDWKEVEGRLK
ncbi:MAG: superoxide dismutase [Candidatus Pacebacteria bacterium]|nr:superoxide dismutase [Candidatus Paceibacterota bacterium]